MGIEFAGKKRLNWEKLQDHGIPVNRYKLMPSRFESNCSVCHGKIEVGAFIWFDKHDRTAMHQDCRPHEGI